MVAVVHGQYNNPIEITGTVFDANTNKSLSNVKIVIVNPVFSDSINKSYKTDQDGNYIITLKDTSEKRTIELLLAIVDYQEYWETFHQMIFLLNQDFQRFYETKLH